MKCLVTGSSGLIGSQLTFDLEQLGYTVYSCYNNLKPQHGIPIKFDLMNHYQYLLFIYHYNK